MIPLPDTCLGCPLYDKHKGFSRLEGDGSSGLMVVAESLGRAEERASLPLRPTAPSGEVFQKALDIAKLDRSTFTITNIIRCKSEAPYPPEAIAQCRQYLDAAVAERKPKMILALGDVPLQELSTTPGKQSELRGYYLKSRYNTPLLATFHPSRIARGEWAIFGAFLHDIKRSVQGATRGISTAVSTNYNLNPSQSDLSDYLARLNSDRSLAVAYDLETKAILKLSPPDEIVQVQFSSGVGEAIVVPFDEAHRWFIEAVFATPNMKLSWNGRGFDTPLLKANGISINGENHDAMLMWAHSQSNFVSSKDEKEGDKRIPSRLLNLQSAVSFYYPQEQPWKGVVEKALPITGWGMYYTVSVLQHYGAVDADMTYRLGMKLIGSLKKNGLWDGYYRFKFQLSKVLDDLGRRGLPIDREAQTELRDHIRSEELRLLRELQGMVDPSLHSLHPKFGYVNPPKFVPDDYDAANPPLIELSNSRGYLVQRMVTAEVTNYVEEVCATCGGAGTVAGVKRPKKCSKCKATGKRMVKDGKISRDELRWGLSLFNPNSSDHVLNYLRWQCERDSRYFIPKHIDTGKDTTNKAGIEHLLMTIDDPILTHIEKCKKIAKLGDYCSGAWVPGDDGRVHAEFRFGSAVNQTSAVNPPVQTYPKHVDPEDAWLVPIIKRIKTTIKAESGHKMVEVDARGFHARVQGFLAGDIHYYHLANFDVHSFNTAHYLKLPDASQLKSLDDDSLRSRLKEIKQQYNYERSFILKRIAFLRQFGGGVDKAATIMKIPTTEVMEIFDMMDELFKPTFKEWPKWITKQLKKQPALTSAFGCRRHFWDSDPQQAVAFLSANSAHCHIQDALIRLHERGALEKYHAVNFVHDSIWYMCPIDLIGECITVTKEEIERPSDVLISPTLGKFCVDTEAQIGYSMGEMADA